MTTTPPPASPRRSPPPAPKHPKRHEPAARVLFPEALGAASNSDDFTGTLEEHQYNVMGTSSRVTRDAIMAALAPVGVVLPADPAAAAAINMYWRKRTLELFALLAYRPDTPPRDPWLYCSVYHTRVPVETQEDVQIYVHYARTPIEPARVKYVDICAVHSPKTGNYTITYTVGQSISTTVVVTPPVLFRTFRMIMAHRVQQVAPLEYNKLLQCHADAVPGEI